jgi:putative redox protein
MEIHNLKLQHQTSLDFKTEINGFPIAISGGKNHEGLPLGISPKKLLLASITGCTAIDVAGMLATMRVPYSDFSIEISAPLTEEHPKVYTEFKLIYKIKVDEINQDKVKRAVSLSKEKYCGVSAMLGKAAPILYEIIFL